MKNRPQMWFCALAACALVLWTISLPQAQTQSSNTSHTAMDAGPEAIRDFDSWKRTSGDTVWQQTRTREVTSLRSLVR